MPATKESSRLPSPSFLREADVQVGELDELVQNSTTDLAHYPLASAVVSNVLLYDARPMLDAPDAQLKDELARALLDGPGVLVVRGAFDRELTLKVSRAFDHMLDEQGRQPGGRSRGDHFARAGENSRVWNTLEKLARDWPELFVSYFANECLALACEAWLGPRYQVTAQLNVMHAGAPAQLPHRDYHLGFGDADLATAYPAHVHTGVSPQLTLQCLIAHTDMPLASGPTCFLPHSQKYKLGYVAQHHQAIRAYFDAHHVQLPLAAGDLVCMNPAVLHGAGTNTIPDSRRVAHLLQVSSAFGRPMEIVDTARLTLSIFPTLALAVKTGVPPTLGHAISTPAAWRDRHTANVVAASTAAYPFPANLDLAPPGSDEGKETESSLLNAALQENWSMDTLRRRLFAYQQRHLPRPLSCPSPWASESSLSSLAFRLTRRMLHGPKGYAAWARERLGWLCAGADAFIGGILALRLRP